MKVRTFKPIAAALLVAGSLGATAAHADGVYGGAVLGTPRYQDNINGVSGDSGGVSGKVFGGYQFNPYFGLEAGYADLGHVDNSTGRIDGRSEYLDAVGTLPLGSSKFSLLGSVGLAHVSLDTSAGDSSGNGFKLGLGAQYALTDHVALRAEAERYHADAFGATPDIDQYTVGVRVGF